MKYPPFDWQSLTPQPAIGVDEAGRGCLAGRVYAAAVVQKSQEGVEKFKDSKLLSPKRRDELFELIVQYHLVGVGFATVDEIATLNILWAAMLAMKRAVLALGISGGHVLVDGNQRIPGLEGFQQTTLIKGDLRVSPVSAASIVAKVSRDRYVLELAEKFPAYGFEKHKGYGTEEHLRAIAEIGPCPEHRRGFAGVREHLTRASL